MYLVYKERFGLGPSWIARLTGGGDHTTVMYGIEQMRSLRREYYQQQSSVEPPEQKRQEPEEYTAEIAHHLVIDPDITTANLEEKISDITDISIDAMRSRARDASTALARHVFCYVLRTRFKLSYEAIAKCAGRSDHTTAMNSVMLIDSYMMKAREAANKS